MKKHLPVEDMLELLLLDIQQQFDPKARLEEMGRIAVNLADCITQGGYENVFFVDNSARAAATATSVALNALGMPIPRMMFINPDGLISIESAEKAVGGILKNEGDSDILKALTKPNRATRMLLEHPRLEISTEAAITADINNSYKGADRNKPTLIVDTCNHSGDTLDTVIAALKKANFGQLATAVISGKGSEDSTVKPDYVIYPNEDYQGSCYPFGIELDRKKNTTSVHTRRTNMPGGYNGFYPGTDILTRQQIREAARIAGQNEAERRKASEK